MNINKLPKLTKTPYQLTKVAEAMAEDVKESFIKMGLWEKAVEENRLLLFPGYLTQNLLEKLLLRLKKSGYITMTYHRTFSSSGTFQILIPIPREELFGEISEIYRYG